MKIETRTLNTGIRRIDIPTVDGLEVRTLGSVTTEGVHPSYPIVASEQWSVFRDESLPSASRSAGMFSGHAAVFDVPTWIGPREYGFQEVIARSAFNKSLVDETDVRMVHNHNPDLVLARVGSGTLRLSTDENGLAAVADLAPTSYGHDVAVLLERGDIGEMSFAFRAIKEQWETVARSDGDGEFERRTLIEVALVDVSTVTWPAYDGTDAGLIRSAYQHIGRSDHVRIPDSEPKPPDPGTSPEPPSRTLPQPVGIPVDVAKARHKLTQGYSQNV